MEQIAEFAGNHPLLVAAFIITGTLLVYNEIRLAGSARFVVSPAQAVRLMNNGALVLDFRKADAYQQGHLSGARNVDIRTLDEQVKSLERFQSKPVVAYDERGQLAGRAVAALRRNQFEQAFALRGGIAAWREESLPVEKDTGKPSAKSPGKKAS